MALYFGWQAVMVSQRPVGSAPTSCGTGAKRPALSTMLIAGEFSVRNTSAGEASPSCMMMISGTCDWSIFRESWSTLGLAPFASAMRDITMAWAWWAIIPCMNSTSAFV